MDLKAVPKPEGFDLRAARANKRESGLDWLPADAIYDASEQLKTDGATVAMVIAWYVRTPDGLLALRYRLSYEHDRQGVALVADLMHEIQS